MKAGVAQDFFFFLNPAFLNIFYGLESKLKSSTHVFNYAAKLKYLILEGKQPKKPH